MLDKFCIGIILSTIAFPALADRYTDFKTQLQDKTGLTYTLDLTTMPQYGGQMSWQNMYHADVGWQATKNLSFQFAHTGVKYFDHSANDVSDYMHVALPINDYPSDAHVFDQLNATYSFDKISITLGQFPIYIFDGGRYDSNQQVNFNNYAFSQNASQAYPTSSLGGFITYTPNEKFSFTVGAQDATNIAGNNITVSGFDQHKVNGFAYAQYQPDNGLYRLLLYYQPSVAGQLQDSWGWSLNARHCFDKWEVFGRINGTNDSLENVRQSYMIGSVYNNPFKRNALDQFGVAYSLNKLNTNLMERNYENVFEVYYNVGITKYFVLTPDFQLYVNLGDDASKDFAAAVALRLTALF